MRACSAHILANFGNVLLDAPVSGVDRTRQGQTNSQDGCDGVRVHEAHLITQGHRLQALQGVGPRKRDAQDQYCPLFPTGPVSNPSCNSTLQARCRGEIR